MTRTIHRVSGRKRWVTIDQRAIEDARLPWAARGLLVYLLSKPDDWQVRVKDLQNTHLEPAQKTQPGQRSENVVPEDVLAEIRKLTAELTAHKSQ